MNGLSPIFGEPWRLIAFPEGIALRKSFSSMSLEAETLQKIGLPLRIASTK